MSQLPYTGVDVLEIMEEAKNYNAHLVQMIERAATTRRVLDFGAGQGLFARLLRDRGYQVVCVEPDQKLADKLRNDGFDVHTSLGTCPERFDFVYTLNVLEHIFDDRSVLKDLAKQLNENGRLFAYVPAFQLLYSRMDERIGHHRRYAKPLFLALTEDFSTESCHYVDSLGFIAALGYKWVGDKEGKVSPFALRIFDRWVFPLSRKLDTITSPFFGKNLLFIGKKK